MPTLETLIKAVRDSQYTNNWSDKALEVIHNFMNQHGVDFTSQATGRYDLPAMAMTFSESSMGELVEYFTIDLSEFDDNIYDDGVNVDYDSVFGGNVRYSSEVSDDIDPSIDFEKLHNHIVSLINQRGSYFGEIQPNMSIDDEMIYIYQPG